MLDKVFPYFHKAQAKIRRIVVNTVNILILLAIPCAAQAPYTTDSATGAKVYQLSDAAMCPAGATHFYSYINSFSPQGDAVFECGKGSNLFAYPVYDANFNLLFADAVKAAGGTESAYGEVQWSQVGRYLYGRDGACGIWKFDPWAKTKTLAARFPAPRCSALSVGPGDRLLVHLLDAAFKLTAISTFDPVTGKYAQVAPGAGFDEAQWTQAGTVSFIFANAPAILYSADLTTSVKQDDNHGHPGYFGRYKVSVKSDTLANGSVGQIGCPNVSPWIPEHAIYDAVTGKRVHVFGCQWPAGSKEQASMMHFSRSLKPDTFIGSGAWLTIFRFDGTQVTSQPLAETKSNFGQCGYWAQPRAASDPTGTRALFDSTRLGGCTTHVFVAVAGGVAPAPQPQPTPTPTPQPSPPLPTVAVTCPPTALASLRCSTDVSKMPRGDVTLEVVIRDASGKVIATGKSGKVTLY